MEDGGWRMKEEGRRMEDGGWRMEDGGWRMEDIFRWGFRTQLKTDDLNPVVVLKRIAKINS